MFVALSNGVMLLSELIIIYLAAAAPFGVTAFLHRPGDVSRSRSIGRAVRAALLWPLILLSRPLTGKEFFPSKLTESEQNASLPRELRIEGARRALLCALYQTEDLTRNISGSNPEAMRASVGTVIGSVESYIVLSLAAVAGANEEASPREMELWRIAGRKDDGDLQIAGRCHQRRHLVKLKAHQAKSRLKLLHALAGLCEVCERIRDASADKQAVRQLLATLLEVYTHAVEIFSLFEDERPANQVAGLLDAARERLQYNETLLTQVAPKSFIQQNTTGAAAWKDEPCPTSITSATTTPQPPLSPTPTTIRAQG
jgi:hypothetical protein